MPLNEDGSLRDVDVCGEKLHGKALLDRLDILVQQACHKPWKERTLADPSLARRIDYLWYLWCGPDSPSFDKSRMATFERYFIADKETHHEEKGWYYKLNDSEQVCDMILREFGIDPQEGAHIVNGHVPVKIIKGEKPVKANGKLLVIDGGFSKAYQPETGIAGYTLVFHSRGLQLVQHQPFESRQKAIEEEQDIISNTVLAEWGARRLTVNDTDKGAELRDQIDDLRSLLAAYRSGALRPS